MMNSPSSGTLTLQDVVMNQTGDEIMKLLETLYEDGHTIVVVTHEENIARNARRIVRLRDGIIESDEESG